MVNFFQDETIRYSNVIIEGKVTCISEVKEDLNNINEVITVLVKQKIAGESLKSKISLKYQKYIYPDVFWSQPKFKVGDNFVAFLRKEGRDYSPIGGAYGVFKIYNDKIEKSHITRNQFFKRINEVRNFNLDSIEFPVQNDIEGEEAGSVSKLSGEFRIINPNLYGPLNGTTIEFQLNPIGALDKDGNQLSFTAVKNAVQRALNTWNNVTHSYATFTISNTQYTGTHNHSDHISTITFEAYYSNGYTHYHDDSEIIHAIDIVFCKGYDRVDGTYRSLRWNTDETYPSSYPLYTCPFPPDLVGSILPDIGPVDLEDIAVHELGHAVGLGHSDHSLYSMMYTNYALPNWWTKTWRRSLEVGDKAGKIYQDPDFSSSATQSNSKILLSSRSSTSFGGTLTVPYGYLLEVEVGKSLSFSSGSSLIINGILNANGLLSSTPITFDFVSPNSSTENGIKFNSGSSGTINYCQIRNAYRGIYENGVSVNITNSAISGCTDGVYLYSSTPLIQGCNIHNNSNYGINMMYSSSTIKENYIQNNSTGVFCSSSSHPVIGNNSTQVGNDISSNVYGVIVFNNANPVIGNTSSGGYNNLVNTTYNVLNTTGNTVYAYNNWWGTTNPAYFKTTVLYANYLTSSVGITPTPPLNKSSGNSYASENSEIPMLSELNKAYELVALNNLAEAREICLNLINNYPDYSVSYNALNLLKETYTENEPTSKKDIYKSLFNKKNKKDLYAMAGLILSDIDKENKLKQINEVIEKYRGEGVLELALFNKFVYYNFEKGDQEKAREILKELDVQFPLSQGAIEAHKILGDEEYYGIEAKEQNDGHADNNQPIEYSLFENYPNPFNPTTKISFALPERDNVKLVVYDILGREIVSLADGNFEAGKHEFDFNATNLPSGVYFYNIQTSKGSISKKMILLK